MAYRVGVDIGGSFTDFAILNESNAEVQTLKVFSRPDQPGAEVLAGIAALQERYGIEPENIEYFTHGTTVGVNTVIQRKGLKLALFTTRNFADVLELARLRQPNMFDLLSKRPTPLISRDMVFQIGERVRADGAVETDLDENSVRNALSDARAAGAEGVVVSLLHAYRNPKHEQQIKQIVKSVDPDLPVFCSNEIWPIIREYERTITATIGGYVQPRVAHYLTSLQVALKDAGVPSEARVAKSNGGVMTAEQGKTDCVQMILSGTASGVIGASYVAGLCGLKECMSLDIGGTSADVALINDGRPQYGVGEYIGEFQIFIPSVSVTSIGDGGGSIAWVDSFGVLHVGPESAGSNPGPACFGRGGVRPTITDAFAVCGLIGHAELGYNAVRVDVAKAREAIGELAMTIGKSAEETAETIIRIAVSGMYSKITGLVTRFGVDPRSMALLAFGGAGPLLGCFLARELGMAETVVPTVPGVLSALGGLIADLKNDFIRTVYLGLDKQSAETLKVVFAELRASAMRWLRDEQGYDGPCNITYTADMRYRGQSFELEAPLTEAMVESADAATFAAAFHETHHRVYGHSDPNAAIQIINARLVVSGATPKPDLPKLPIASGEPQIGDMIDVWLDGAYRRIPFYERKRLLAGHRFAGPAVISQDDCTTCIPSGFQVRIDPYGHLRITPGAEI